MGTILMPIRRKNQDHQWTFQQERFLKKHRRQIETSFSILSENIGMNSLKTVTLEGFYIKVYAAVLALIFHITLA